MKGRGGVVVEDFSSSGGSDGERGTVRVGGG
jgi:hypothetical protein